MRRTIGGAIIRLLIVGCGESPAPEKSPDAASGKSHDTAGAELNQPTIGRAPAVEPRRGGGEN
jgi:hypothetical protein